MCFLSIWHQDFCHCWCVLVEDDVDLCPLDEIFHREHKVAVPSFALWDAGISFFLLPVGIVPLRCLTALSVTSTGCACVTLLASRINIVSCLPGISIFGLPCSTSCLHPGVLIVLHEESQCSLHLTWVEYYLSYFRLPPPSAGEPFAWHILESVGSQLRYLQFLTGPRYQGILGP